MADFLSNLRGNDASERNLATSAHIDRSELESDALVMRGDDLTASKKITGPLQGGFGHAVKLAKLRLTCVFIRSKR